MTASPWDCWFGSLILNIVGWLAIALPVILGALYIACHIETLDERNRD